MIVSQLLSEKGPELHSVNDEHEINKVIQTLAKKRIGLVVVTDNLDQIKGVLSERDIVRALGEFGSKILQWPAKRLMSEDLITCQIEATISEVMHKMTENRIRHLPILNDEKLIGIISIGDVLKNRLQELENEGAMLRQYISNG
jgi:CBS domain-containing protein